MTEIRRPVMGVAGEGVAGASGIEELVAQACKGRGQFG